MFGWFRKQKPEADGEPGQSTRSFCRACNVYVRPESDEAIVASVFNHEGPTAEKPGGAKVAIFSNTSALSESIREALACCEYQEDFNYSTRKPSDWPAYQASGCKTIEGFEAAFIRLSIRGVNDANLFYEVTTPNFGEHGLHLVNTIHAGKGCYGESVQYLVKQYLVCKAAVDIE